MIYSLDEDGQYGKAHILDQEDVPRTTMFEDFEILLADIFQEN